MSRLYRLPNQPFEDASNRGFRLLLLAGVILLALVAILGRTSSSRRRSSRTCSRSRRTPVRNRPWNESLANVDAPTGREEASVDGFVERGDDPE